MNPRIDNVRRAFECVQTTAAVQLVDRTGHAFPSGGHFQGVQRIPGTPDRIILTSSSDSEAYMVCCRMQRTADRAGTVERVTRLSRAPLDHAGGFQADGAFLAIGVEDDDARNRSQIQLWRHPPGGVPTLIGTIYRSGPNKVSTAGAVGIAARGAGMVLAVGTWDCETIDFYTSPGNPLIDSSARFTLWRTWQKKTANKDGWEDKNFGNYQSLNLVTQADDPDDQVFMVGFNRSDGDDWMDLYSVNMSPRVSAQRMLRKIDKKHMICRSDCSFEKAAGLHIVSTSRFEVYAAKGTSGDHATGTTITLNHFRAD